MGVVPSVTKALDIILAIVNVARSYVMIVTEIVANITKVCRPWSHR